MAKRRTGYRIDLRPPYDKQVKTRNRFSRFLNFITSTAFLIGIPMAFTGYWGSMFGHAPIGLLVGFGIGGAFVAQLAPSRMFVYNPEWTGYVTQDIFRGTMIPYGPGFHFSHWWEERNKQGNYSLKVITRDFRADVATQTAKVEISGKYEYAIDLALIVRAIGVDETTIESGITAFIESFLTSQCAGENADDVRKSIDKLNDNLADEFMCLQEQHENFECEEENKELASFGNKYGFITVSVVIDNIKLPEAAQKTRDAIDEAVALHSVVAAMYGISSEELKNMLASKTISVKDYNTMLNRALAASDNAKMNLNVIEADIPALIGKLADQFTKGGRS